MKTLNTYLRPRKLVKEKHISILALCATCLAFLVIGLGAYTRLSDSGLGCPDWPGCYGHILPSASAAQAYTHSLFNAAKAYAEMIHRYVAASLALLILCLTALCLRKAILTRSLNWYFVSAWLLILLFYQVALGMLTVSLKLLPIIVTGHLFGGYLIFASCFSLFLWQWPAKPTISDAKPPLQRYFCYGAIVLLLLQIFLGAWTSTHYSALSCKGFPFCHQNTPMVWDFRDAFHVSFNHHLNYDGGLLSQKARATIQMVHRFGALVVFCYITALMISSLKPIKCTPKLYLAFFYVIIALFIQLGLGISTVLLERPVLIALLHNYGAALLLLSLIHLCWRMQTSAKPTHTG